MAIENAKTLNVRIRNKYDSYENWAASSLVLEAGEIAIAYTTVNVEVGNGKIEQHPELLMKVGDGSKTFSALPWLSAKAADVAAWAKAADKPVYEAKEIAGIADYIAEYVEDTMGITVDTNTVYRTVKVDDYNYKLQSKGAADADTAWTDVADSVIVIPNDTAAIQALQGLVGQESVATQIVNYVTGLNLAETYAAKTHTHAMNEVTDLTEALAGKETSGAAAKALEDAKAYTDEKVGGVDLSGIATNADEIEALKGRMDTAEGDIDVLEAAIAEGGSVTVAIADAKQAGIDANDALETYTAANDKALADEVKAREDGDKAIDDKIGAVTEGKTVVEMISDAQAAATYDDTALAGRVKAVEDNYLKAADKEELQNNIDTVSGAVERLTNGVSAEEVDGVNDLIQYVKDHGTEVTGMQEDISDNADAIAGVAGRMDTAEGKITDLEGAVATKAEQSALEEAVEALEGADSALSGRIDVLEGKFGGAEGSVEDMIADAKAEAIETAGTNADTKDEAVLAAAKKYADDEDAKIESRVDALETASATHALATDLADLETEVGKKANDAELAAVAKSGLIDDISIGEGTVLVFDCGNSGVVAE